MKEILELLSYAATVLGIPTAISVFVLEKRRERQLEELDAHAQSNSRYVQYLERCLATDDYSVCEFRPDDQDVLASGLSCKALVSYTIIVSMMEIGYLRYRSARSVTRRETWSGWVEYIREWATRADFRKAWPLVSPQFDAGFVSFAADIIAAANREANELMTRNHLREHGVRER